MFEWPRNVDESNRPRKRIRLHHPSIVTDQAVIFHSVVRSRCSPPPLIVTQEPATAATPQVPPQRRQPHELRTLQPKEAQNRGSEPAEQQIASTSKVDESATLLNSPTIGPTGQSLTSMSKANKNKATALQRKPTKTVSSSSLDPKPSTSRKLPLTVPRSSNPPLAFNYFNPATDLRRVESPVLPSTTLSIHTEQRSGNLDQMHKPLRRSDSLSRRVQSQFGAMGFYESSPLTRAPGDGGYAGTYA